MSDRESARLPGGGYQPFMPTDSRPQPPTEGSGIQRQQEESARSLDPWRQAIEDAMVLWEMALKDGEAPMEALHRLLMIEQQVVLDPAVSTEARALIERGAASERKKIVGWLRNVLGATKHGIIFRGVAEAIEQGEHEMRSKDGDAK